MDLFKLRDRKSDSEWEQLLLKWKKWDVLGYMRPYLAAFFPGKEQKAKEIGLIDDDAVKQADMLQNDDELKDDTDELDLI